VAGAIWHVLEVAEALLMFIEVDESHGKFVAPLGE
jgi:hypothetical protein